MTPPAEDDVTRSAAILACAGLEIVLPRRPVYGVWHLLGVNPISLILVTVVRGGEWPDVGGINLYRHPPGWPPWTRRLVHRWPPDALLPDTLAL